MRQRAVAGVRYIDLAGVLAGVVDEAGKVDRIRDILFGPQMRDYDSRFQKLEERLTREAGELRGELQHQLQALEGFMRG